MTWYTALAVIGVGFVAGFINTLAGSGSLLTLPMLMFLGLPANVANGTNRIGVLLQSVVGVSVFKQKKVFEIKEGYVLTIPAIIGALVGAQIAINLDEQLMRRAIGLLLFIMFFLILYKPDRWIKGKAGDVKPRASILQIIIFFFIGVYGGFIQAGVGFFLLAGLVLGAGYDVVKANAVKLFIVLAFTLFALVIFILHDQVDFKAGLILAVGNMAGAFVASKFAVSWGPRFVRYILLAVILISGLELSGLLDLITG
ncbi:MAG TPA: sulfite exporter TauE/SafE family protein [Bacteroidales bacterium]|nr:sulfite exporter TauE/SafE family protein [Bacteroidales bacterium]